MAKHRSTWTRQHNPSGYHNNRDAAQKASRDPRREVRFAAENRILVYTAVIKRMAK